ncbi:sulfatase [Saccharicrinis aurantiacus]|uniref:sulfatase n=1 Tax=Saccharicrinis aurantiacus TaxID=1849719 RepID=UPI002490F137|nr:sulfatase [Saccharicrinis aurantiacus]
MNNRLIILAIALVTFVSCATKEESKKKPNILFIAFDDLRPELGCYGVNEVQSPNLDAIGNDGLIFDNAYCQQAICSPSRASLMTGARPETIGVVENYTYFRDKNPDIITLPQFFKQNGYETTYAGKIYHGKYNDPDLSWSRKAVHPKLDRIQTKGGFALKENQEFWEEDRAKMEAKYGKNALRNGLAQGPVCESADVPDYTYEDGYNTECAIATLKEMVSTNPDKPFFLGLGFKKPHLNFIAPKKYWDLYNEAEIPLAKFKDAPVNGAAMGLHPSFEMRARAGVPKQGDFDDDLARYLLHGYLACVSYVDAQLGKMVDALEEAGVRDNTIIIVWGDHGWHLGDMGIWGKATNYEISTRVPLMIWTPDMKADLRGSHSKALVELVDMYPTLADLAGLEAPSHLEGHSFSALIDNPNQEWKKAVFSQFPNPALREWAANPLSKGMRETYFGPLIEEVEEKIKEQMGDKWDRDLFENRLMGYGMRTEQYRFVVWKDYTIPSAEPIFYELYDHTNDPYETVNVADDNPEKVKALYAQFKKGWKGNLPN